MNVSPIRNQLPAFTAAGQTLAGFFHELAKGKQRRPAAAFAMCLVKVLVVAGWVLAFAYGQIRAASVDDLPKVNAVQSVGFTVAEMNRSVEFFREVLEFEVISDTQSDGTALASRDDEPLGRVRRVQLKLGDETIELKEFMDVKGRPMPSDSRANDRWFQHVAIIVSDMDRAYQRLRDHKVRHASSGPQTLPEWNKNAAGVRAFYFRDPDGHFLEILQFPKQLGDPKWHRQSDKLFQGIDHTAIVVGDTDESLKFYRDQLGMRVAGTSENFGSEQEHLNGVFGAKLRITTLRAAAGPGIELLEYLFPSDGRGSPTDIRANDVMHWQVHLSGEGFPSIESQRTREPVAIAAGDSADPKDSNDPNQPIVIRDPDGHALQITSQDKD